MVAVSHLDRVIHLIRSSPDGKVARERLMQEAFVVTEALRSVIKSEVAETSKDYFLTEQQAQAILDLRLQRLTGLEQQKLQEEWDELCESITHLLHLLSQRTALMNLVKKELTNFKTRFGTPRKTEVVPHTSIASEEELIKEETMVVTLTYGGYIKRVPLEQYRLQRRGGKGRSGMAIYEDDFVRQVFVESTHTRLLCFSSRGMVYYLKVYQLPSGSPTARGKAFVNLLPLAQDETIATVMPISSNQDPFILFATKQGFTRRNALSDFENIRSTGKIAIKLQEGDELLWVSSCNESQDIFLSTRNGRCVRFNTVSLRLFQGRNSVGVRGIQLTPGDEVISATTLVRSPFNTEKHTHYLSKHITKPLSEGHEFKHMQEHEQFILSISQNGFGKRTSSFAYRCTSRNCKGIANMNTTPKTGLLTASFPVTHDDQLVLITSQGQIIRSHVKDIRIAARSTQGVRLFDIPKGESVVSAVAFSLDEDDHQSEPSDAEESVATQSEA